MAAKKHTGWVRSSVPPDEIRVAFVVKKEEYPELVQWLWGLPYRRASTEVRGILNEAARRVSSKPRRGSTSTSSAVSQETLQPSSAERPRHEAVAATPAPIRPADAKPSPSPTPAADHPPDSPSLRPAPAPEMTAEVADLMLSYGRDF